MIKPEQIPDEVVRAFLEACHVKDMTRKGAIAAALAAWPGVVDHPETVISPRCLWLPLTQEPRT